MARGGVQSYFSSGLGFGAEEGSGLGENPPPPPGASRREAPAECEGGATSKEAGVGKASTSRQANLNPRFAVPELLSGDSQGQRKVHRYARKGPFKTVHTNLQDNNTVRDKGSRMEERGILDGEKLGGSLLRKADTPADDLQSKRAAAAAAAYTASLTSRRGANGAVKASAVSGSGGIPSGRKAVAPSTLGFQGYSANGTSVRDQEVPALSTSNGNVSERAGGPRYGVSQSATSLRHEGLDSIRATYGGVKAEEKRPEATGISSFLDPTSPPPEVPTFFDAFADASTGIPSKPAGSQSPTVSSAAFGGRVLEGDSKAGSKSQGFSLFSDQPVDALPPQQQSSAQAQGYRRRPFATVLRQQKADGLAQGLNQLNLSQQQGFETGTRLDERTPVTFGAQASKDVGRAGNATVFEKERLKDYVPGVTSKQAQQVKGPQTSPFQNPPEALFGQKPPETLFGQRQVPTTLPSPGFVQSPLRPVPPQGILPFVFSAGSSGGSAKSRNERDPSPLGQSAADAESLQFSESFAERLRLAKPQEGVASSLEGLRGFLFKGSVPDGQKDSKQDSESPFAASRMSAEGPQMSAESPLMSASPQTVAFVAFGSTGSSPGTPAKRKSEQKSAKKASPSNMRKGFNPTRTLPRTPVLKQPVPARPTAESTRVWDDSESAKPGGNRSSEAEPVRVESPQPMDISPGREDWENFAREVMAGVGRQSGTSQQQVPLKAQPGELQTETPKRHAGKAAQRRSKRNANGLKTSAPYDGDLEEDSSSSEAADQKASDWARKWEPPKQPYIYDSNESDSQSDGEVSPEVWAKGETEKLERLKKTAMEEPGSSDEESGREGESVERVEQLGVGVEEMDLTSVDQKEHGSASEDEAESSAKQPDSQTHSEPVGGHFRAEGSVLSSQEGSEYAEKKKPLNTPAAACPAAPFVFGAKAAAAPQTAPFTCHTDSPRSPFSPTLNEAAFVFASAPTSPKSSPRRVLTLRRSKETLRRSHEKRHPAAKQGAFKQQEATAPGFVLPSTPLDAKAGINGHSEITAHEPPEAAPPFGQNTTGSWGQNAAGDAPKSGQSPPPVAKATAEEPQLPSQPPKSPGQVRRARRLAPREKEQGLPFTKLTAGSLDAMDEDVVGEVQSKPVRNHVCYHKSQEGSHRSNKEAAKEGASDTGSSHASPLTASISQVKAGATCERWRLKGNQAYASKDYKGAETLYTKGVEAVLAHGGLGSQGPAAAAALCLSNRAAVRMVLGRVREALADCRSAAEADPGFTKVRLRAASCHVMLGEYATASALYAECKSMGDAKMTAEAAEGLARTSEFQALATRAAELLQSPELLHLSHTMDISMSVLKVPFKQVPAHSVSEALKLLSEAIGHSPQSEALLQMKALALLELRKFEEALSFCESSLSSSQRNSGPKDVRIWRWRVSALAQYHLGRIEEADELAGRIESEAGGKLEEEMGEEGSKSVAASEETVEGLRVLIKDLLKHKAAGNAAFQAGKREVAIEHYSAALACNSSSRPFNAVCLANRAAAYQALGSIAEAIADCSRAIVLDPGYAKALSRRATLHELIRDHSESVRDLERLSAILASRQKSGPRSAQLPQEIKEVAERKKSAQESAQKEVPVDHYKILGVEKEGGEAEIKKAYRRAALRHHPDKAVQFLSTLKDDDKAEMTEEIHREAERLFKLIGEAYNVLSNPSKRMAYDVNEEERSFRTSMRGFGRSTRAHPFSRSRAGRGSGPNSWSNMRRPFDPDWADEFFGRKGRTSRDENTADNWDTDYY